MMNVINEVQSPLRPVEQIELNLPQMLIAIAVQKHLYLEGGRGLGKSFIVSWRIKQIVESMPRAKCALVGRTYEQLLTRTLPSTLSGLAKLGFVKNLHFFVQGMPPKKWKWNEAYEAPLSYDYCITFYNGTTFQMVSLDKTESGRGFNFDAVIGDEAALLDYEKLQNNVLLSCRGNLEYFGKNPLHYSTLFVSTTPVSKKGRWFTNREEMARNQPHLYLYMVAPSRYNLKNLGEDYFRNLKRELLPHIYDAEIDCIKSGVADRPFYPTFNANKHTYLATNDSYLLSIMKHEDKLQEKSCLFDADVNTQQPLDLACDYNAAICWASVGQMMGTQYNLVNAIFVLSPKTLVDLINEFADYYRYHKRKEVNFYYDHTAVHKDAVRTTTYAETVQKILQGHGWKVNMIYCGQAPLHETKKLFFEKLFRESPNDNLPTCRLNQERCKFLIVSIEQAGTKDGTNGMKKDKSSETRGDVPDEEATHGSDCFDTLVYFRLTKGMQPSGFFISAVA